MKSIKRILIVIVWLFIINNSAAKQNVFIGIHMGVGHSFVEIKIDTGAYEIWANGDLIKVLEQHNKITLSSPDYYNHIEITDEDTCYPMNFIVMIKGISDFNMFNIQFSASDTVSYSYEGDLSITANFSKLKMVNIIDIQKYLKGVVKAEIGDLSQPEFLKAMSIVSRTYTIKNRMRHEDNGFDLCDETHCQVYCGENDISDEIKEAIRQTEGLIIVDKNNQLINAVFHSNSGGQIVGSEYVWAGSFSYLKSKPDPFAEQGRNYKWQQKISIRDWRSYLSRKTKSQVSKFYLDTTFVRSKYYYCNNTRILLADIRRDLKLRSTYFVMKIEGDTLILNGRGYGHGVGLCQEGANRMAELNYEYKDIIKYYYNRADIIDYENWKFLMK